MKPIYRTLARLLATAAVVASSSTMHAQLAIRQDAKGKEKKLQRVPTKAFESQSNKVSNVEYYSSNYGIFGLNIGMNTAGVLWPRGSGHSYIFGGGLWFGAKKNVAGEMTKMAITTYNANTGNSAFVPGRYQAPGMEQPADNSPSAVSAFRIYNSTEYDHLSGQPLDALDASGPYWPMWNSDPKRTQISDHYLGSFIEDASQRRTSTFSRGPAIISDEDIVSTFRDNDIDRYGIHGSVPDTLRAHGYPIGIQVEQSSHAWNGGDFIVLTYTVINTSGTELHDCYIAPMLDADIGSGANDHAKMAVPYAEDDSLDLIAAWSDPEADSYGYLGIDLLETPAIDPVSGYLRHDKRRYDRSEQLGAATFRAWTIEDDPARPEEQYEFMASGIRDVDKDASDKRILFSTGPFSMHVGDTMRIAVGFIFARSTSAAPTGQWSDMKDLVDLDIAVQKLWDNGLTPATSGVAPSDDHQAPRSLTSYPNPTASATTIRYELPGAGEVELRLYDQLGREIARRDLGYQSQRENTVTVDCSPLLPGVYTYEIRTSFGGNRGTLSVVR